ncbi:MAG: ABC transporter permease [Desulfobacteraceae bacterium]|nr:ABC transporter permease [Desulfobacteraceae bacterium]
MWTIFRKELADHFSSSRFLIMLCLIAMVTLIITYMAGINLREELSGGSKPGSAFLMLFTTSGRFFSLSQFITFFGPLLGIIMGFDAINGERSKGTLPKLLSQPIYRDAIINGKFLAGVAVIAILFTSLILLIAGLGLLTVGAIPGINEVARLIIYLLVSIAYVAFWLGLSIVFSILFRSVATSALAGVALWIFLAFFTGFCSSLIADAVAPVDNQKNTQQVIANREVKHKISLISPVNLYTDATSTLLNPYRKTSKSFALLGPMERISMNRFQNPLPLGQSLLVVVPYLTTLLSLTVICFGAAYICFLRQEIRST